MLPHVWCEIHLFAVRFYLYRFLLKLTSINHSTMIFNREIEQFHPRAWPYKRISNRPRTRTTPLLNHFRMLRFYQAIHKRYSLSLSLCYLLCDCQIIKNVMKNHNTMGFVVAVAILYDTLTHQALNPFPCTRSGQDSSKRVYQCSVFFPNRTRSVSINQ